MNILEKTLPKTKEIYHGNDAIRRVFLGETQIWERKASYFYLRLDTSTTEENT